MLQVQDVSKSFPGVKALDKVSIDFFPGEIHGLVGENGAGKSTLIKIICGIYAPDEGTIRLDEKPIMLRSYADALKWRVNLVNQEILVIPKRTIAENIMLDKIDQFSHRGYIDWASLEREAQQYLAMVELTLPVKTLAGQLSAAQKQLMMIAKALSSKARVLILDEPTSALTQHEVDHLFPILRQMRSEGVTIIFVSHKLEEVLDIADRVSVLRDGHCVGTRLTGGLTKQDIVTMMIGRDARSDFLGFLDVNSAQPVLEATNITRRGLFDGLSFCLNKGEILGFYGLVGSGRTELAQIVIGEAKKDSGQVLINGMCTHITGMADSLHKYKMGYISEDRKYKGLILRASIKTNIAITIWRNLVNRWRAIRLKREGDVTMRYIDALSIKATSTNQLVEKLSGGNQQKVSIAKWLAAGCDILIVDEPTIGVDVGAKEAIHQLIWDLAKKEGKSIILISSDMPEMVRLARRILVFRERKIVGEIGGLNEREHTYDEVSHQIGKYLT